MASRKPGSVYAVIYLSSLPGGFRRATLKRLPIWDCSRRGLPSLPAHAGSWWALTPPFHLYLSSIGCSAFSAYSPPIRIGSLFSVALSVGLLLPAFRQLLALWSPDFPPFIRRATARKPQAKIK